VPVPDPVCPPPLAPRARIRIVAPSGPFDRALLLRGAGWLAGRYRVELDRSLFSRHGYLAGSDERRAAELNRAISEPGIGAVVAARGGYGLLRILPRLDLTALRQSPRWIVGFSDITALHVALARRGVVSLHAHNAAGLGRGDAFARQRWVEALENPTARRVIAGLDTWQAGSASGPLFGGNLTLLAACAGAGILRVPRGAVLVIEDVTESSYRVDRLLTTLELAGALDAVSAAVIGDFTDCPPGPFGVPALDAVAERLHRLRIPLLAGLRFGHGRANEPLPLGLPARVEPGVLTICP
jgi:muramoyltetrapeptide carboxypeptidase